MLTRLVENYPGFPEGIQGPELIQAMRTQAERAGAEVLTEDAVGVDFARRPFVVRTQSGREVTPRAVIVGTGASAKMLGLPSEERFIGRGVSMWSPVMGSSSEAATSRAAAAGTQRWKKCSISPGLAHSVTVVHRRNELRASKVMQERALHPKVRFTWNNEVVEILGDDKVTGVRLRNRTTREITEHRNDGVFLAIGHRPNVDIFRGVLEIGHEGYILVKERRMSSVEGVFVAGDVRDHKYRQVVTAAGFGAMAAIDAARWLQVAGGEPLAADRTVWTEVAAVA